MYETDQPMADVIAAFEAGEKGLTAPSPMARVLALLDELDAGAEAMKGTGSRDFGRGVSHTAKLIREAINE